VVLFHYKKVPSGTRDIKTSPCLAGELYMRVILATDGSIEADLAEAVLKKLPIPKNSEVTVGMVTHLAAAVQVGFAPESIAISDRLAADTWKIQRQIASQTVGRIGKRLGAEGYRVEQVVLEGNTADQLLDLISQKKADAVVAGCGVNSNFAAFFLGSVSRKLVLYSPVSILVGRHYAELPSEGSVNKLMSKEKLDILVAVDGSEGSKLALRSLSRIEHSVFRKIVVLCVEPISYSFASPMHALVTYDSEGPQTRAVAEAAAEKLSHCGDRVEALTAFGRPSVEIARVAKEQGVDVVMLGANRHGAIERFFVGSCAYETATGAPCSVLILRDVLPFE
jgi:nucleotide-binding universal stress UspA family protein